MENKDPVNTHCSPFLQHGFVYDDKCQRQCGYVCLSPYKTPTYESYVDCDATSGNWVTASGEQPCMRLGSETTTKKMFDLDAHVPDSNLFQYQNNIDFNNYPTYKPPDIDIPSYDFKTPKPFSYEGDSNSDETNSGAVFGLIIAGIIGTMIIFIFMRVWIARCAANRRQRRMQHLFEQVNSQVRQSRQARDLSEAREPPRRTSERTNNESENEEAGLVIIRIRRFLRIPLLWNPYSAFRNPPEPPPYDAESVPPPAYEETEGTSGSAAETNRQPAEVSCTQSTETPADPPPPYSANIV